MGEKRKRVYEAMVDGATEGLSGDQLFSYIRERCPKVTSKKFTGGPGFWHQVGSEQMRQHRRVNLVRFDLGIGDCPYLQGMGENDIVTYVVG